jgi:glycosyltransferase involved in cell wall biosynthesis
VKEESFQLTVVTAVFNGAEYIEETIESVLRCCRGITFEYIVIDDGSTDSTLKILESFGPKIKVISQENLGESAAVNVGIFAANSPCCLVVSADDPLLTPELFEDTLDLFAKDPLVAAVYPDWQMIGPMGEIIKTIEVPNYSDELLIGRCRTLPGPGVIFRTTFAQQIGGRRAKWTYVSDYDFWLRISRLGEIRHRHGVLAQWRYHQNSTSVTKRGPKMARERIDVMRNFLAENSIPRDLERMALGTSYYLAARLAFFSSEIPAKTYLFMAFKNRKKWIEGAQIEIIIYILLLPFSRFLINPLVKKFNKYRTLI